MIRVRIDITTLKGTKFGATDEERKIMSYTIQMILQWYHELNYENYVKYIEARKCIIDGREDTTAEKNALFWVKEIAQHHINMEYNVKIMG